MSQVIFNSYIDMATVAATPSGIGYTIGYDVDGILKQKDENGVITPVAASQDLETTLSNGNYSGTYSIKMGAASRISSINGSGNIQLDYGSTSSVNISVTASGISNANRTTLDTVGMYVDNSTMTGKIEISHKTFSAYVGTSTYSTFIENFENKISIGHKDTTIGADGKINVFESGKTYDGLGSVNKAYVHINSFGSTTSHGVMNSVIIGGAGITASRSNYVYLGNWVNVNNAYTLPNVDGLSKQILTTNGNGTVSWATFSVSTPSLSDVLLVGNTSGSKSIIMDSSQGIILGTNSIISTTVNGNIISLDNNVNDILISSGGIGATQGILILGTNSFYQQSNTYVVDFGTTSITTRDLQGLKYTADYSSTFTSNSLVTKSYVDSAGGSYNTHLIAYVDPNNGSDVTGTINKPNKPYQSIDAAMLGVTSSNYSALNRAMIWLRKGDYTSVARLENNVDYYCDYGVKFTQNGFRDYYSVTSNIYGNASFFGTNVSLIPLVVAYGSTIRFEFDTIDVTQSIGRLYGTNCNILMQGRSAKTKSGSGYGLSVEGNTNLDLVLSDYIMGAYETIFFQTGYSGNTTIKVKTIYSDGTIGNSGVINGAVHAVRVGDSSTGTIKISADVSDISATSGGNNAALHIASGNVTMKGDVNGNNSYGIYLSDGGKSQVVVEGNIFSMKEAIYDINNFSDLRISNSLIKSEGLGSFTQSIYMGSTSSMYISNSTVYNGLTDSSIIKVEKVESMIGIYNSLGYSPGSLGDFINCTFSDYTIGLHNVRSNKDNGNNITDLFDPSGFIYDPYLFVPKF